MPGPTGKIQDGKLANRKLKAHKKSRQGCGNCKLRKVKCDERKPTCQRCEAYGIGCTYNSRYADLQPVNRDGSELLFLQPTLLSEKQVALSVLNQHPRSPVSGMLQKDPELIRPQFSVEDINVLNQFYARTIPSLGTDKERIYLGAYNRLTPSHPYLIHIALALTLIHDRHLMPAAPALDRYQASQIAYHWYTGVSQLNHALSHDIHDSSRDALWATAGLLGAVSFSNIDSTNTTEAWPLKLGSSDDLEWLRMTEGKRAIWDIAGPWRSDSVFHKTLEWRSFGVAWEESPDLGSLPSGLLRLCRLDGDSRSSPESSSEGSSQTENPYETCASYLANTADLACESNDGGVLLRFFGCMSQRLKPLIVQKDPAALALLANWCARMARCRIWWSWRRACLEGLAICRFLEQEYGHDWDVMEAISEPTWILEQQNEMLRKTMAPTRMVVKAFAL